MKKGFLYQKGTNERIPYWVTEEEAEKVAAEEGGTKDGFSMALKGYGIMDPVVWEFREEAVEGREHWDV